MMSVSVVSGHTGNTIKRFISRLMKSKSVVLLIGSALLLVFLFVGTGPNSSSADATHLQSEPAPAEPPVVEEEPSPQTPPVGESRTSTTHNTPASLSRTKECFMNKVYFQPARCSRTAFLLDAVLPLEGDRMIRVAHVGLTDAHYRLAEFVDVFEKEGPRGTLLVRDAVTKNHAVNQSLCGECCECVSAVEKQTRKMPFQATLFLPKSSKSAPAVSSETFKDWWTGDVLVTRGLPGASDVRLAEGLDVLSLDYGSHDVSLIKSLVLTKAVNVRSLLQFTTVDHGTNYTDLVNELRDSGFVCFIFTAKPLGRTFRGVRLPAYPVAVQLTDCWRPPYNSFAGEPFQMTCVNEADLQMMQHLRGLVHKSHRGGGAGCLAPHRLGRKKRWEDSRDPRKAKEAVETDKSTE